jgi:hypothetical protein
VPELAAFQRQAADWFGALSQRRGVLIAPPGSGKTRVASAVISELDPPGLVLVVIRGGATGQWLDSIAAWQVHSERMTPASLPDLVAARNRESHEAISPTKAWVVSQELAGMETLASTLESIAWQLVVVDEAQSPSPQAKYATVIRRLTRAARGVLYLASTPGNFMLDSNVPVFRIEPAVEPADAGSQATVQLTVLDVQPNPAELDYLEAISSWSDSPTTRLDRASRSGIARYSASGLVQAVEALELLLSDTVADLDDLTRSELRRLLELAYLVDLPDSRTRAVARHVVEVASRRVAVVGAFPDGLKSVAGLLDDAGVPVQTISPSMDGVERQAAARQSRHDESVLLLSDPVAGSSLLSDRDTLVHADLPLSEDFYRRLGLLVNERVRQTGERLETSVVRWAVGYRKEWIDSVPRRIRYADLAS